MGNKWYKARPLLSRNPLIGMAVGGRGIGKTYAFKVHAIKKAIRTQRELVYLRRYPKELLSRDTFFDDISDEFPNWDFRIVGMEGQIRKTGASDEVKWRTIIHFMALSAAQGKKSGVFNKVDTIIFDEFILEPGLIRYIPDEVTVLLNLYSTIARNRDDVNMYMLSNAVSLTCPYFLFWDIHPESCGEWSSYKDGMIVLHLPESSEFKNDFYQTRFGKLVKDSEYAQYAVENVFRGSGKHMVERKPSDALYGFTLHTPLGKFSAWINADNRYFLMSKHPKNTIDFCTYPAGVREGVVYLAKGSPVMGAMRTAYSHGRMFFESAELRESFISTFK